MDAHRRGDRFYYLKSAHHAPVYTLDEIAAAIGIPFQTLAGAFRYAARFKLTPPPEPELAREQSGASRKARYARRRMIDWYAQHLKERDERRHLEHDAPADGTPAATVPHAGEEGTPGEGEGEDHR